MGAPPTHSEVPWLGVQFLCVSMAEGQLAWLMVKCWALPHLGGHVLPIEVGERF
jgi:hypothetical protein